MHLVPRLVGCEVHVSDLVEEVHAHLPFFDGQVDLARKVVDMFEESREDLAGARRCTGSNCVDHGGSEFGVVAIGPCVRAARCVSVCGVHFVSSRCFTSLGGLSCGRGE